MAYLTSALDTIRGYTIMENQAGEEYKFYDENAYNYNDVRDAIVTVLQTLMFNKYPDVDISTEIQTIQTAKLGTTIREAIYSAVKKLLNSIGIVAMVQISQVRYAHYGSDMREPLYDILIKLGADDVGSSFVTQDGNIFYTADQNKYCIIKKGAIS